MGLPTPELPSCALCGGICQTCGHNPDVEILHTEIERLRSAIKVMNPGFCVEEAVMLFGTPTQAEAD